MVKILYCQARLLCGITSYDSKAHFRCFSILLDFYYLNVDASPRTEALLSYS